jgi:ABC-2 type transport system ATP-binding protein
MTGQASTPGIVARDVCKSFGSHLVLDKVNLTADEGTILALLGPNGAGKTTIVRILSTLIPADSGSLHIAGHDVVTDPDGVRALIGVTGQFSAVDNLLTGAENLRLMADLRHLGRDAGRRRMTELLEQFDLTDAADKPLSTYSGGMRRRLDLAMTLVGEPRVIFLDDHRIGPAQPPHHVGDRPRARLSRSHHTAHHPVPRRGGPAGRPDRGARPGPDRRRRNPG